MPVPPTARHKASRKLGGRRLLWAVPLLIVAVVGGLYLGGMAGFGNSSVTGASDTALTSGNCGPAATPGPAGVTAIPGTSGPAGVQASGCARPSPTATPAPTGSSPPPAEKKHPAVRRHRARHHHATHAAATSPAPHPTTPPPPPPSPPAQSGLYSRAESEVLALINQARSQAGRPAYTVTSGLVHSSSGHTQVMASGCGLSHQCPGEPPLGTRETNAGVHWTSAGENIGEAGPISRTSAAIAQAAVGLTQDMLNEKPPDDGHRLNILSSSFHHAGISVFLDSHGTVWMTQDFSN
jgi:uncharacterized protein YkwD